mmetsp:Transcript_25804/g.74295  ORF Transcript_25804/g.74295 Transcript_25804/m.74295 type:complete len:286 (+) Transcript_25804:15-872(+)
MKGATAFMLALVALASFAPSAAAFQVGSFVQRRPQRRSLFCRPASTIDNNEVVDTTITPISARDLRSIQVTNVEGKKVRLGDVMPDQGASVVVYLRHLGCTWCWSYVYQWKLVQEDLNKAGIKGPIFVSIGDEDRLNAFLLKNPEIPAENFFVDGYDFSAYREAGFGRFDEKPKEIIENVRPKPANFGGFQGWWTFLTSFIPLAPVTPDMKFPENLTPEGLFWVGGTFVVNGNDIIYRWNDRISGDHPEASDILEIAKNAAATPSVDATKPDIIKFLSGILAGNR